MSRNLPVQPNLEHLKKEAKALLRAHRQGDNETVAVFSEAAGTDKPKLADAQFLIARRYGFENWGELKRDVELVNAEFAKRADAMTSAACAGRLTEVRKLLDAEPALATANIFAAAVVGNHQYLENALSQDETLVHKKGGPDNLEPILYACFSGCLRDERYAAAIVRSVDCLLNHGADANSYFLEGDDPNHRQTVLYAAAGIANNAALTKLLIDHGADPNDGPAGFGETVYHSAEFSDLECLRLVLEAKPRPDTVSYCLARKLDFEDISGARLFLEHGADPNFLFKHGHKGTRLHHAILRHRSPEIIRLLLAYGADWRIRNGDGITAFAYSVRLGNQSAAQVLREAGAREEDLTEADKLIGAMSNGDEGTVRSILTANPGITSTLTREEMAVLPEAAHAGNLPAVRLMLEAGFDAGVTGIDGMTALHWAAWSGHLDVVDELLRHGAKLEALNHYGGTVLYSTIYAAINGGQKVDHIPVIRRLLEAGAQIQTGPDGTPVKTGNGGIDALLGSWSSSRNSRSDLQ
ncbi:MAG TPA: ankyrin repeat domain-containing protein [Blastocatellia bacterium]|nr:ankyrin repeat domain-containing protein [Blastocatellia bacterium]